MIKGSRLGFSYFWDGESIPVFEQANIELKEGEWTAILGCNGCGKSTLVRLMNGLLPFQNGNLSVNGINAGNPANKWELCRVCGMVFQNPGMSFNPIRKIGAQFLEALKNHGKIDESQATKQILDMFTRLGLRDGKRILNSYPFELSGGMNQRVAIALAMILNPQLLLADEPTSALDVTVQAQCVKEMMDLRQHLGTTIIIVTHNMGVVSHMADKVAVMYA